MEERRPDNVGERFEALAQNQIFGNGKHRLDWVLPEERSLGLNHY